MAAHILGGLPYRTEGTVSLQLARQLEVGWGGCAASGLVPSSAIEAVQDVRDQTAKGWVSLCLI